MSEAFVNQFSIGGSGLKVAVKDTFDVAGFQTMAGSQALRNAPLACEHADVVNRIIDAGCQLVGKLVLHEFAYGMTGINHWSGSPLNPNFPDVMSGGSSSGSAVAVAEASVDFSLGTDTGGSIRLPAACCGVYGLKPTFGRISRRGVLPQYSSLDCVGPIARDPDMLTRAMAIIDPDFSPSNDSLCLQDTPMTLLNTHATVDIKAQLNQYVNGFAPRVKVQTLPLMKEAFDAAMTLINAEAWAAYGEYLGSGLLGDDVQARLDHAQTVTSTEVEQAEHIRVRFTEVVDQVLALTPLLLMPALPDFPISREQALAGQADLNASAFLRPFNLSGHPALVMPIGVVNGKPVSLQLVANKGRDAWLCQVAKQINTTMNQKTVE